MIDQQGNVLAPLTQGRQLQGDDVEPVVEVLPELALAHQGPQVTMGGGHHADVHLDGLLRPHRHELLLLQDSEQPGLERGGHVPDLIQEERAPVRLTEKPRPAAHRPGKRPADVAEQLALQQTLRQRGAVHPYELGVGAVGEAMEGPCHQLLAGTGLPHDQHRGLTPRHAGQRLHHFDDCRTPADEGRVGAPRWGNPRGMLRLGLQTPPPFQRPRDHGAELLDLVRFANEVVGTGTDRLARGDGVAERGQHDHDRVGLPVSHQVQQVEPGLPRHPQVGEHQIEGALAGELPHPLGDRERPRHVVAFPFQHLREEGAGRFVVVDQEQPRGGITAVHAAHPVPRRAAGRLNRQRVPRSACSSVRSPPIARASRRLTARPRPEPSAPLVVTKAWNS